jgi:formylglycine-generating enzyme
MFDLTTRVVSLILLGLAPLGCGLAAIDSPADNGVVHTGGRTSTGSAAGGGNAPGGTGLADAGDAGSICYRDPYLPDNYVPPCDQPKAVPNCTNGWCTIEPGCFIMGDSWCQWARPRSLDDPVQVTLTHRFRMQQFEVTQQQWTAQGVPNPSGMKSLPDGSGDCMDENCPVGNITWFEALAYANLLSQNDGIQPCYDLQNCQAEIGSGLLCDTARSTYASVYDCPGYRLPTGAEWEYAARAGTKTTVYTGDILDTGHALYTCYDEPHLTPIAWYCNNSGPFTHPAGQLMPNDWGLYDTIGNAMEWTNSDSAFYGAGPFVDWDAELNLSRLLSPGAGGRQLRGGAWNWWPNMLRVGYQFVSAVGGSGPGAGFRLVQTLAAGGTP